MATQAAQLTLEQVKFSLLSARIKLNSSWVVSAGEIAAFRSDERENALVCVTGCRDLLWKKYMFAAFPWHLPSLVMKCCLIRKSRHLTEHDLNINNERTLVCADVCHVTVATFPLARQEVSLVNRKSFHICSVVTQYCIKGLNTVPQWPQLICCGILPPFDFSSPQPLSNNDDNDFFVVTSIVVNHLNCLFINLRDHNSKSSNFHLHTFTVDKVCWNHL